MMTCRSRAFGTGQSCRSFTAGINFKLECQQNIRASGFKQTLVKEVAHLDVV